MGRLQVKQRSRRIQTTITFALAVLVFVTALGMGLLSYTFTQQAVQQNSREYTVQLVSQVQTSIDSYIDHMENIATVVQLNDQVQRFFRDYGTIEASLLEDYRQRISAFLDTVSRTRGDISLILIAGDNGEVLTHKPEISLNPAVTLTDQTWYRSARERSGSAVVSSSHVQNVVAGEYRWVITLSRTINDPVTGEEYGVMLVDMNFSVISDLLARISLGKRGYLFIVDPTGSIVFHPRQELIYSNLEQEYIDRVLEQRTGSFSAVTDDRRERIYTVSTSDRTGWRTVGVNYAAELVRNRATIQRYYLYGTLLFMVVAILVAVLISHRLSRPILRLRSSMQAVEQGDFDITVDISGNDEIGDLARDFNIMVVQIRQLMRRNAEEQEEKRRSELLALQNQITPHFLYNTLDSIVWMAEGGQHRNVVQTVASLARLLRLSISHGDELISIRDEVEHITSYLTIQKLRYRDTLDFSIEVDSRILHLQVPKVILQPLVENAIYHGIKHNERGGCVTVCGRIAGSKVILEVFDDGTGMEEEQMRTILDPRSSNGAAPGTASGSQALRRIRRSGEAPASSSPHRRNKVGVRNVHERIRLYFGDDYGLLFRRNGGAGTVVEIHLPVVEPNGDHPGGSQ